ncbi:Protein fam76a [Clonorchis sinensis]|uniref:Protein fam76a n=2 Tax=Clonorchis sinensis TaxID=79923 RepID=A0A8T1MHI9_CLOSI|nr:Protein fam76a [Clonorchis sinensis]
MEQPLFACTKCFRNFPQSEMSRSGQMCKSCNPHHSTFKQCEYCKSDFKYYVYGTICPRCQSLKSKYGEPQPCSICRLQNAFGNALVCQRCMHYRVRFGEPRECQNCGQMCAFLKDEASRQKVDGQILCWVCTYNFKLARSRERSDHGSSKRRNESSVDSSRLKLQRSDQLKRTRSDDYKTLKTETNMSSSQPTPSTQTQSLDSAYNEHLLTISQLQDEVKALKRQLAIKDAELLAKDRTIADLRSDMIEMKDSHEDRLHKTKAAAQMEQDRLTATIKQLQKEKASISQGIRKRKSATNLSVSGLRHSASSVALFNPDSPTPFSVDRSARKTGRLATPKRSEKAVSSDDQEDTGVQRSVTFRSTKPNKALFDNDDSTTDADQWTHEKTPPASAEESMSPVGLQLKSDPPAEPQKQSTSSPSISSGPASDDEIGKTNKSSLFNPRDPLGLDTPTESEEEDS